MVGTVRKFVPRWLSICLDGHEKLSKFNCCLSMRNDSVSDEIVSALTQCAKNCSTLTQSVHAKFSKKNRKNQIKCDFNYKEWEFSKTRNHNRTKMNVHKKLFCNKKLVLCMLSHCKNVQTSKFWQKLKENNQNFLNIDRGQIMFLVRPKRHFKISHACVPLKTHRNTYKIIWSPP